MAGRVDFYALKVLIEKYVADFPAAAGQKNLWRTPLVATAPADDRFDILPEIAVENHALPKELLATGRSVIVFFVPFIKELAKENHKGKIPCSLKIPRVPA